MYCALRYSTTTWKRGNAWLTLKKINIEEHNQLQSNTIKEKKNQFRFWNGVKFLIHSFQSAFAWWQHATTTKILGKFVPIVFRL